MYAVIIVSSQPAITLSSCSMQRLSDPVSAADCDPDEFRCQSGDCIMGILRCDGTYDCPDYDDEFDCCK